MIRSIFVPMSYTVFIAWADRYFDDVDVDPTTWGQWEAMPLEGHHTVVVVDRTADIDTQMRHIRAVVDYYYQVTKVMVPLIS